MALPLTFRRAFSLATPMPRDRISELLREQILSPGMPSGMDWEGRAFVGRAEGNTFTIRGFLNYRSSFLPMVRGRILDGEEGTSLEIRMGPHREVVTFLSIWLFFLALCVLVLLFASTKASRFFFIPIPVGLALFSWILGALVFESDCRWALGEIERVLAGEGGSAGSGEEGGAS